MRQLFGALWRLFAFWVAVFLAGKLLFMVWNLGFYANKGVADWWAVLWHGLPLDLSIAGYLSAVPALLLVVGTWWRSRWLDRAMTVVLAISALAVALAFVVNSVLYAYWGFPLDSTPLFYFFSSPKDAFASASISSTSPVFVASLPQMYLSSEGRVMWASKKT